LFALAAGALLSIVEDGPSEATISCDSLSSSSSSSTSIPRSVAPFPPALVRGAPFHDARFSILREVGETIPATAGKLNSVGNSIASLFSVKVPSSALNAALR